MKKTVLVIALAALCQSAVYAQTAGGVGGLAGVVLDPSGARVANAAVEVDNERLGIRRRITSSEGGVFSAPALAPSAGYVVTVKAAGFAAVRKSDVTIPVGQDLNITVRLEVQAAITQVEVAASADLIETKTDVSQNVSTAQIDNLPINGRRVDSFVLLTPAVVPDGTFGLLSFRGIPGGNNFMTDGNDTTRNLLQRKCRPHPHPHPNLAGCRAGIPGPLR